MNRNYRKIPARFEPEARFEIRPEPPAPFRALQENEFEKLKTQLLEERLAEQAAAELASYLQRAANEAAALAWVTAYPLLVFPTLFEEKANAAAAQAQRQESIRERSLDLLTV